jgi:hypothetical protein
MQFQVLVDALSLIYDLAHRVQTDALSAVSPAHDAFTTALSAFVSSLRASGIEPVFYFDTESGKEGAIAKLDTSISRQRGRLGNVLR